MRRLTFAGYYSKIGWTQERGNGEILWYEGKLLQAIKIQSDVALLVEGWCPAEAAWISPGANGEIRSEGKTNVFSAIKIAAKDSGDASVCYRVYLQNSGWTDFCRDGECCGISQAKAENVIEGIQIFWMGVNDDLEIRIKTAERKLSEYMWAKTHLFIRKPEEMLLAFTKSYLNGKKSEVVELKKGVLLPLQKVNSIRSETYVGGVLDKELNWIAGHERNRNKNVNYACVGGYEVDELDIRDSREEVIFGGIFIKTFGLFFTECLSRMWYIAANETNLRIAVLPVPGHEQFLHEFTRMLGIEDQRLLVIDKPTRFAKILVPDQTVRIWSDFRREYITVYNKILENVTPGKQEKIYLTKSVLPVRDGINEHFFERFFSKRGFKIIAPEKYSIREMISMMAGAKEVVCTEGTLSYLGLFCKKGTEFTIIRRSDDSILIPQMIINQARGLKVTYIDATHNFLPVTQETGVFLYGPTPYFEKYLKANHIEYSERELTFDIGDFSNQYIKMWFKKFSDVKNFEALSGKNLVDVISCMNREFGKGELNKKHYVTQAEKRIRRLKLRTAELENENIEMREKLKKLENREAQIKKRRVDLKKRETELKNREVDFNDREAELKNREAEYQNREAELKNRESEMEKRETEFENCKAEPEKHESELKKTEKSWSPNRKRHRKLRQ